MPVLGGEVYDVTAQAAANLRRVTEKDNSQTRFSIRENELSEVLVLGQQNPTLAHGKCRNFDIGCLCMRLRDRYDVMAGAPECANHRVVAAFVGQEAHLLPGLIHEYGLVVGERLGGETHGCTQILPCEARIGVEEIVL